MLNILYCDLILKKDIKCIKDIIRFIFKCLFFLSKVFILTCNIYLTIPNIKPLVYY